MSWNRHRRWESRMRGARATRVPLLVLALLFAWPLWRCDHSVRMLRELEADPFVKQLADKDESVPRDRRQHVVAQNNRVRVSLLEAWTGARAPAKAVKVGHTIEGDPVAKYMTVGPARATVVCDFRMDKYADRSVGIYDVHNLQVGTRGSGGEFLPLSGSAVGQQNRGELVLRYEFLPPNRGVGYF